MCSSPACRDGISRLRRPLVLAVPCTLVISAVLVIPAWIPTLPRPLRRELTEAALHGTLVVYSVLFCAASVGTMVLGGLLIRARKTRPVPTRIATMFVACLSCLIALFLVELGATAWRGWMHRFPALPTEFVAGHPRDYRIVVVGESSASGEPYWPWLSVGQIVAWQLSEAIKDRRVECEIVAYPGDSLEVQHHKLAAVRQRPDAMIIYSGHNEFAARYEEEREGWQAGPPAIGLARIAYRVTSSSPFCSLAYEIISKNRLDRPPSMALRHELIDPPVCCQLEAEAIHDDFRRRLEALVSYCEQIGALAILIVPPANEAGYEPSRSTVAPFVTDLERKHLVQDFKAARALEARDSVTSAKMYAAVLERHPGFAEAHFRLARILRQQGRTSEAGRHFLRALDNDGLPLRCPAPLRAAYEEVSSRHPRAILIDGRRELAALGPDGLLGDQLIHDTHHPTLKGHAALAVAVLKELEAREVFGRSRLYTHSLNAAACAEHFGMDSDRWADVCDRVSEHYRRVAGYRHDPTERLDKAERYARAALRIRSGAPIDDLGLPLPPVTK